MAEKTFSESWHRVAKETVYLRATVRVGRQTFRGERWMVIEDPVDNKFFRVRPVAWEFLARLSPSRTVGQAWEEVLRLFPEEAPGQSEVVALLSQLYRANLLFYPSAEDGAMLFDRQRKRKSRELRAKILGILFTRIPLVDPDRFLVRTLPWVGWLISPFGLVLWLFTLGFAGKVLVDNYEAFFAQGRSVLAPDNLILLYGGLVFTKLLHELGHAYFCRRFGGEVHTLGVMLLVFTPIPYMDATSSWGFRRARERVWVGLAGMVVEIFVAALALFVWAATGPGTLNSFAYNMVFVASVTTIFFNANPLLRFDGYYIMSDLAGLPNLHQRSAAHLKHIWKRYVYGVKSSKSPASAPGERRWFVGFGILSNIYRILVFAGILLFIADQFLILGLLMLLMGIIGWVVRPIVQFLNYLVTSPELDRVRGRAMLSTGFIFGGLIWFLVFVPFPSHFRAQGVVQAVERKDLVVKAAGTVTAAPILESRRAEGGALLLALENPESLATREVLRSRIQSAEARLVRARHRAPGEIAAIESRLELLGEQLREVEDSLRNLDIYAEAEGELALYEQNLIPGSWLARGTTIGRLLNPKDFEFLVAVRQEEGFGLFDGGRSTGTVRLRGQADSSIPVKDFAVIPGGQQRLPSPVLGARFGGEVAVVMDDPMGVRAAEPFYLVRISLPKREAVAYADGQIGTLRLLVGREPLMPKWWRQFRQLLQRRYQL